MVARIHDRTQLLKQLFVATKLSNISVFGLLQTLQLGTGVGSQFVKTLMIFVVLPRSRGQARRGWLDGPSVITNRGLLIQQSQSSITRGIGNYSCLSSRVKKHR